MKTLVRWSWTFGLAGFVLAVGAFSVAFVYQGFPNVFVWLSAGSAACFALYGILDRERVSDTVSSRQFLFGSGSLLMVTMVGVIGAFAYVLAERHDTSWDVTRDQAFTLSGHTIGVMESLEKDYEIVAFFRSTDQKRQAFEDLTRRAAQYTDKLDVRFVDPLRNPLIAEQFQVESDGIVIVRAGEEERRMEAAYDEQALTKTLVLLESDVEHEICWSLGHGEPDPDDIRTDSALGGAVAELEELNYQVMKTYAMTEGIKRSCDALIIAAPALDWFPYEREALAAYIAEGGRVLLLVEPFDGSPDLLGELGRYGIKTRQDLVVSFDPKNQMTGVDDPSFVVLSDDNLVVHPVTRSLSAAVVLGGARSLEPAIDASGMHHRVLLQTGPDAWAETDLDDLEDPSGLGPDPDELVGEVPLAVSVEIDDPAVLNVAEPDDGASGDESNDLTTRVVEMISALTGTPAEEIDEDTLLADDLGLGDADVVYIGQGIQTLFGVDLLADAEPRDFETVGDIVEAVRIRVGGADADAEGRVGRAVPEDFSPQPGGRLLVIGDSDFASNRFIAWGNNKDLFLNSVAWLVKEEAQLGERPEEGDKLDLTGMELLGFCLLSLFLVPGLTLTFAAFVVLRRRFL